MAKEKTGTEKAAQISARKLKELVNNARTTKANISELSGALGSAISQAIERNHLHRKAFRAALAEDKMEPDKLADYYDALDYYRDVLGLIERAKSAPRLAVVGGTDTEEAQNEAAE